MPTRKVRDYEKNPKYSQCLDPEHLPPTMVVWDPGEYEHECPRCHHITKFIVPISECNLSGLCKVQESFNRLVR
jgi:hypothetical protein